VRKVHRPERGRNIEPAAGLTTTSGVAPACGIFAGHDQEERRLPDPSGGRKAAISPIGAALRFLDLMRDSAR